MAAPYVPISPDPRPSARSFASPHRGLPPRPNRPLPAPGARRQPLHPRPALPGQVPAAGQDAHSHQGCGEGEGAQHQGSGGEAARGWRAAAAGHTRRTGVTLVLHIRSTLPPTQPCPPPPLAPRPRAAAHHLPQRHHLGPHGRPHAKAHGRPHPLRRSGGARPARTAVGAVGC